MPYTVETFGKQCHDILTADPGKSGRERVCALVQDVLRDKDFVAQHIAEDGPERKPLYEDADLGFVILAHSYQGAKGSPPHDHGPTWAIYGQASGTTIMTDWTLLEPASEEKPGKVRATRTYTLEPGMAYLYEPGFLHSPKRDASTRLIRIEGQDVTKIRRLRYEAVETATA